MEEVNLGIKRLTAIGFVRKDVIAALGEDKECRAQFVVRDIKKQKDIIQVNYTPQICQFYDFAIHKSRKYVALSQKGLLTVFDALSGKKEWHYECDWPQIAFCPVDDPKVAFHDTFKNKLIIYSNQNEQEIFDFSVEMLNCCPFVHHPVKKEIILNVVDGYSIYDYDKCTETRLNRDVFNSTFTIMGMCCNGDGSCIAMMANDTSQNIVALVGSDDLQYLYPNEIIYKTMLFHPNNKILFLLSSSRDRIESWDCKNKKCNHVISFKNDGLLLQPSNVFRKALAISDDGRELFIAMINKCIKIPVTLEMLYGTKGTTRLLCSLWAIKQIKDTFSSDVATIMMQNLIQL